VTVTRFGLALRRDGTAPADLYLDDSGSLAVVRDTEAVGQHVRQRLMTYLGEWFLDREAGVPWVRDIVGHGYDPVLAESVLKAEILDTDGVIDINSFSVRFDSSTRGLSAFDIDVLTDYDQEVSVS
jgi:hypothetical protein